MVDLSKQNENISKPQNPKSPYLDIIDLIGGDLCVIKPNFL